MIAAESLDIGSVRLTERHVTSDPTTPDELAAITKDVDAFLDATTVPVGEARALIGVAGTVTTVAAVALRAYRSTTGPRSTTPRIPGCPPRHDHLVDELQSRPSVPPYPLSIPGAWM